MLISKKLAPEDKIPLYNKPPLNPPVPPTQEPTTAANGQQQQENNLNEKKQQKRPRKYIPNENFNKCFEFIAYEHFAISEGTIREMCGQGDCCNVHILFKEAMEKIPQIGLSCLSRQDLWRDQAELQGPEATTSKMPFIMIPFEHDDIVLPQNKLANISPRKDQTFTVTLSIADERGIRVRFSFMSGRPSIPQFIRYPPLMDDYSLIIGIEKKELYTMDTKKRKVEFLTTYGWLQWRVEHTKEESNTEAEPLVKPSDEDDFDCIICYEKGTAALFALFYPCSHSVVHKKCLKNQETGEYGKECYTCRQQYEKLITMHFPLDNKCQFCYPRKCSKFDSYCYPCGCSLGCIKGFKFKLKDASKMSLNCSECGKIIENIQPFYRA